MAKTLVCKHCDESFILLPGKPGLVNECPQCCTVDPTALLMAKVAWSGKHTVEIEITADRASAISFNKAQRRFGAGVMMSLTQSREPMNPSGGRNDQTRAGAGYTSGLGEKRTVK